MGKYQDFVGILPAGWIPGIFRSCSWLGVINVYKFPLDNFHLYNILQLYID